MSIPIKKEPESSVDASTKPAIVLGALSEKAVLSIDGWRFMSAREPKHLTASLYISGIDEG
jgi:hypothetical protein